MFVSIMKMLCFILMGIAVLVCQNWILLALVCFADVALPILCAFMCIRQFTRHKVFSALGMVLSVLLELQHLLLYLLHISRLDPDTASHIGADLYWFLALAETIFLYWVLYASKSRDSHEWR
jgi:hypothetical protein